MDKDVKRPKIVPFGRLADEKRDALAMRLGVLSSPPKDLGYLTPLMDTLFVWAAIGKELAQTQPEFTGKTGKRGRTKHKSESENIDYKRACIVRVRANKLSQENPDSNFSDKEIIRILREEKHVDFINGTLDSIYKSALRGNKTYRKAYRGIHQEIRKNLIKDLEEIKKRKAWIDKAIPIAIELDQLNKQNNDRGILETASLTSSERVYDLRQRLINPHAPRLK
jgi:hypothetical protein